MDSPFAPWDSTQGRYGRAGITFDDQNYADNANLLAQANALFDDALAAGSIYHLADHPNEGRWHDGSYLLQHLNHVKGRSDVWYVPFGQLYQYHFIQEMRGNLSIQHIGTTPVAAGFSATPVSGTSPLSVSFTDTSTGTITGWLWDFGDSATSTVRNPVHVYANPGSYTVRLTVTGPGGAVTTTLPDYIMVTTPSVKITAPANEAIYAAPAVISIAATPLVAPGGCGEPGGLLRRGNPAGYLDGKPIQLHLEKCSCGKLFPDCEGH